MVAGAGAEKSPCPAQLDPALSQGFQPADDVRFSENTHGLVTLNSTLEEKERGNTANPKLLRNGRRLVDVDLGDLELTGVLSCNLLDNRRKHSARGTPRSPKIDEQGFRRPRDNSVEIRIVQLYHVFTSHKDGKIAEAR
jgi:hypothetical protein